MSTAISVENVSKLYRLGLIGGGTLRGDVARWWAGLRGLPDPLLKVDQEDRARRDGDRIWALRDVSFQVEQGEVLGIIGRNGAGKSTLLKILSRITAPTAGQVKVKGRLASLLEVGTGFHPELTGRENIYLNGAVLGMSRREVDRKFDAIVDFAEVERFIDTPVKRYSSGMYVRLAFAVAAHLEPEILVVDEVLAVGDAAFQKKCLGKMGEVARAGRTVLFVSHNMSAIEHLCRRALLIQSGVIRDDGPPDRVIGAYLGDASQASLGVFDYSNHPARSPRYAPLIQNVTLRSNGGPPTTLLYPDDALAVDLAVEPRDPIRGPRFAFSIEDNLGRRIMTVASYFHGGSLPDIDRPCVIRCTLPRLNLGTGRYLISVSIATKYHGLVDSVDSSAWFEVGWRNNYGNGEPYYSIYGPVLAEARWELVGQPTDVNGRAVPEWTTPLR